jgi:hypothetical protein
VKKRLITRMAFLFLIGWTSCACTAGDTPDARALRLRGGTLAGRPRAPESGAVYLLSGAVYLLSGAVYLLSGPAYLLSGPERQCLATMGSALGTSCAGGVSAMPRERSSMAPQAAWPPFSQAFPRSALEHGRTEVAHGDPRRVSAHLSCSLVFAPASLEAQAVLPDQPVHRMPRDPELCRGARHVAVSPLERRSRRLTCRFIAGRGGR